MEQPAADERQQREPLERVRDATSNGGHANSFGNTTHSLASRSGIDAMPVTTWTPWVTR